MSPAPGIIGMIVVGDYKVEAEFEGMARKLGPAVRKSTVHYANLTLTAIRRNASGRPGPNVITGDYRRSWGVTFVGGFDESTAEIGTDAPQFRRLEYGFHGVDSLGRHYDQPPYPHLGPAIDYITPLWIADLERIVNTL